jgi:hypothetical protein
MDELQPILKLVEADTQVVEEPPIGKIDRSAWSHRFHHRGDIVQDEAQVMSYVYDAERDLSDVVILDAQDFAGEPIATIRLPVRVPFGFHGGWAPDRITVVE